jgi:hypothetical protein
MVVKSYTAQPLAHTRQVVPAVEGPWGCSVQLKAGTSPPTLVAKLKKTSSMNNGLIATAA